MCRPFSNMIHTVSETQSRLGRSSFFFYTFAVPLVSESLLMKNLGMICPQVKEE